MSDKIVFLRLGILVNLSLNANDWALYDIEGRDDAAQGLNRDVEMALAEGDIRKLDKVLDRYSKWGAADSEGYHTIARILRECGVDDDKFFF